MCRPVTPSQATSTANPEASRPRLTAAASRRSSSTTSTRTGTVSPKAGHARITLSAPSQPACGTVIVRGRWTTGGGSKGTGEEYGSQTVEAGPVGGASHCRRRDRWRHRGHADPVSAGIPCTAGQDGGPVARRDQPGPEAAAADRHRGGDDLPRAAAAAAGRKSDAAVVAAHRLAHDQGLLPERAAL